MRKPRERREPADPAPVVAGPSWPEDAIEVGKILGAWGIKGGIKVAPFADDPQALFATPCWHLQPPVAIASQAVNPSVPATLQVSGVREQGDAIVALAEGIADRNAAESLKGARVFVPRACFPAPEADEFYWIDLIGAAVSNREGVALGEVVGLIDTGPHCVLRVRAPATGIAALAAEGDSVPERLIPFVEAYVDTVDVPARTIVVDWGLDY